MNNTLYITNFHAGYMEMPELLTFIQGFSDNNGVDARSSVMIEPKASGKTLKQLLSEHTRLNAIEIKGKHINEGKMARVDSCTPTIQSGKVKILKGSWNDAFILELCTFPNAKHDEAVDCLCYAVYDKFINGKTIFGITS